MLIFLYGSDDYRRKEKETFYIAEFKKKYSALGVARFDLAEAARPQNGREGGFEKFREFVRNRSIFEVAKLVVVSGASEMDEQTLTEFMRELVPIAEEKSTTVILSDSKKPGKEFAGLLKKAFKAEEFDTLSGYEWEKFVRSEAKKQSVPLTDDAVRFLAEAYAGDSWRLVTELAKLSNLRRTAITQQDLEQLDIEITPNFFELLSGLKSRDIRERLTALERMFSQNEPAGKIFNIAAYQLPGRLEDMASYDLAVKSGKMDYEEALLDMVL